MWSFVAACTTCAQSKNPWQLHGLFHPLPIPTRPWSHILWDFIQGLPTSQGNSIILLIIYKFSKACCLIPLPKLPFAQVTVELMCACIPSLWSPWCLIGGCILPPSSGRCSVSWSGSRQASPLISILSPMARHKGWIKIWKQLSTAYYPLTQALGATTTCGQSMHTTLYVAPLSGCPHLSTSLGVSPQFSWRRSQRLRSLQQHRGLLIAVSTPGWSCNGCYNGLLFASSFRPMAKIDPPQLFILDRGFGFPPRTFPFR